MFTLRSISLLKYTPLSLQVGLSASKAPIPQGQEVHPFVVGFFSSVVDLVLSVIAPAADCRRPGLLSRFAI